MANRFPKYNSKAEYDAEKDSLPVPYVATYPSEIDGKTVVVYANVDGTKQSEVVATAQLTGIITTISEKLDYFEPKTNAKLAELEQEVIYDVSSHNDGAVFESLQTLLSNPNLNTLIPISVRHGGMNIRFVQGSVPSSDNKYVQYCYRGTEITGSPNPFLDEFNWNPVDFTRIFEPIEVETSIYPNILNRWGRLNALTIQSFQGAQDGYVNEYMLEFTVSGDSFVLTLPEGVRWLEEPTWEYGYTYQVSIIDNLAVFAGWEDLVNE